MLSIHQLLLFLPSALLVSLSPGPNNLLAFRNGMRTQLRSAGAAVSGRLIAFAGMLSLVVTGLSALLTTSQLVFEILKWTGAVYLVAIGLHILWTNRKGAELYHQTPAKVNYDNTTMGTRRLVTQEFITAAANPKALLVFTAFLPQFVSPSNGHTAAQLALLGATYLGVEATAAGVWIIGGRWLANCRLGQNTMRRINRSFGLVFVGLGAGLAVSSPEPSTAR